MTWQLLGYVVYCLLAIGFLYYLEVMEMVIEKSGRVMSVRNFLRGPSILINNLNKNK